MAAPLGRCGRILAPVSSLRMGVRTCSHIGEGVPYQKTMKDQKGSSSGGSVPEYADVVVVGGGSLGCNTLYHLAKLGATNTVLLEAHKLTAGVCVCVFRN
ncbi:Sarcosine dehydrogenase, mitochondrial [Portunus trituberculatus]|uniref:Sarcosine dehydrogenase, mitochondrial n=1 Tax=Portunus trituberculatus TaxID=210409 RepID=A0A5B7JBV7_PORTR|nr:Sarcosine dehydrogenase, mitochondrial [Portunus trituberculatus]